MSDLAKILKDKQKKLGKAPAVKTGCLPLDDIQGRRQRDTRPLNQTHVEALSESIALLGLIEPLVVDSKGRLLAGGHRRAAIALLRETSQEVYAKWFADGIPVHQMGLDSDLQPDLALEIEISENEKREPYTRKEVQELAQRLREAGYADTPGRPKKGQKRLRPALELIVGKSLKTVQRYLNENKKTRTSVQVSNQVSDLENLEKRLKECNYAMRKLLEVLGESSEEQALAINIEAILEQIGSLVNRS